MVTDEEFERLWAPSSVVRNAFQSDDPYSQQLAARVRDLCRLFAADMTAMKFRLLDSLLVLLVRFAGDCRGHGLINVANPQVWGADRKWLLDAKKGITDVLTERKPLRQEYRVAALRLYDLLAVLFGPEWTCDPDGAFPQLVVGISQVELEVTLESIVRGMEDSSKPAAGDAPSRKAPNQPPPLSDPPTSSAQADSEATARTDLRITTLTTCCSILQTGIRFLTGDEENEGAAAGGWSGLSPDAVTKLYGFLVAAYSTLLNYFVFRQGVVREDSDVASIGLLEDLMRDMDPALFAEEVATVKELLHSSGYYDQEES